MNPLVPLVALAALAGVLWLLDRVIEDQRIGLYVVFAIGFADLLLSLPEPTFGGITVTVFDVMFVLLTTALAARLVRGWSPTPVQLGLLLVLVVMGYSIARGAVVFGLAAAVNEARATLYFVAVVLYASFLRPDRATRDLVARLFTTYCVGILGVCVLRWSQVFAGVPGRGDWFDPAYGGLRVVYSNDTLALSAAFLLLLPRLLRGEASRREWQLCSTFGLAVLVLQHRSVMAVLLAGSALQLWRHRAVLSRRLVYGGGTAFVVVGLLLVSVLDGGQLASQASSADASNTVTFEWRVQGWQVLLRDSGPQGPVEALLGVPYGSGYERVLPTGERVDVFPHNMYLELLLRIGMFGVLLLIGMSGRAWSLLRRQHPQPGDGHLDDSTLSVLLVAFALYMVPYNLFNEVGVIIGLALSAASARSFGATDVEGPADAGADVRTPLLAPPWGGLVRARR